MRSALILLWSCGALAAAMQPMVLRFDRPAKEWVDGLPLGNGTLGAVVSGGIAKDRIALNHTRLWRRSVKRESLLTGGRLAEYRRLFLAGNVAEAGRLLADTLMTSGGSKYEYVNPFQPAGDLSLEFQEQAAADYVRELDLDSGVASVSYRISETRYRREYFASAPGDNAIAVRITAEGPGTIAVRIGLSRVEHATAVRTQERTAKPSCITTVRAGGSEVTLDAKFGEGFPFAAVSRVSQTGGTLSVSGEAIDVRGAREVVILTAIATGDESADPAAWSREHLPRIAWEQLRARHVADHQALFRRVQFSLGAGEGAVPTPQLIDDAVREKHGSARLFELLFQYGRYLMISGSRPGGLPMNLQGIWNDQVSPPWDCDFHMDLNVQFNYWPAEVCNLSESHQPLFDWAMARIPDGRRLAHEIYDCRGVYFGTVGDPTGLGNTDNLSFPWTGAAGWLAQHFWRHWEYTGDRAFLAKQGYPFLKEVAAFYEDFLFKDANGKLVVLPSASPENAIRGRDSWSRFTTISSTMDLEIAREVLEHAVAANEALKADPSDAARWRAMLRDLPLPKVNAEGRLLEWAEDVEPADYAHRHLSPLYGLFPGDRIASGTPADRAAARKLFEQRLTAGNGSANGWSYPWRTALFARLEEGDRALAELDTMTRCCVNENLLSLVTDWRQQGLTIDWFKDRKVFQVEAGLATTAAMAEMLLQSHGGIIRILPALPARWAEGSVAGLVARGGFVTGIEWHNGHAKRVTLHSRDNTICRVRPAMTIDKLAVMHRGRAVRFTVEPGGVVAFQTQAGQDYTLEER